MRGPELRKTVRTRIRYGEARLLEYEVMATVGKCHLVAVRLEVVPPKGEIYEIKEQWVIPVDAQSYLQVGLRIPVGITARRVSVTVQLLFRVALFEHLW